MTILTDYTRPQVRQKYINSCIPASFEWLLKYHNILPDINWDSFQTNVLPAIFHFTSVMENIELIYGYPKDKFHMELYDNGNYANDKCVKIKDLISSRKACLVSIKHSQNNSTHISPAVKYDYDNLIILDLAEPIGNQEKSHKWEEIKKLHIDSSYGREILYLK